MYEFVIVVDMVCHRGPEDLPHHRRLIGCDDRVRCECLLDFCVRHVPRNPQGNGSKFWIFSFLPLCL
jgi:hypothetical protein